MVKTKRYTKKYLKKSKSKKIKRGGRKNNTMALQTTQMIGGQATQTQPVPAPAPTSASLLKLDRLNEQSVIDSLTSFGDAVLTLRDAVVQGKATADSLQSAVATQQTAINSLKSSADILVRSVIGYDASGNKVTDGVFQKIVVAPFIPTPVQSVPIPSPSPSPV